MVKKNQKLTESYQGAHFRLEYETISPPKKKRSQIFHFKKLHIEENTQNSRL